MRPKPVAVELDAEQLRMLAHPLRHRLLSALRLHGPATATTLATALDTNTGKTSYHLRQLAGAGLVVEETSRGDARDRWWSAAHDISVFSPAAIAGDADAQAALDWLVERGAQLYAAKIQRWAAERSDWAREWTAAADMSDLRLRLSPERLRALHDEILAVVDRYLDSQDDLDDAAAQDCTLIVAGFPDPEPVV